jgi:hypothetical protein
MHKIQTHDEVIVACYRFMHRIIIPYIRKRLNTLNSAAYEPATTRLFIGLESVWVHSWRWDFLYTE